MIILVWLLAPFALLAFFVTAVRFNNLLGAVIPLVLLVLLFIYQWDFFVLVGKAFARHCLLWTAIAFVASLLLGLKLPVKGKVVLSSVAVIIACVVSVVLSSGTVTTPVSAEKLVSVTEVKALRHQGDGVKLDGEAFSEFQEMMAGLTVRRDVLDKSREFPLNSTTAWYCVEGVQPDGELCRISFFKQPDGPELMRVEMGDTIDCYQGETDTQDLCADWINGQVSLERQKNILEKYREPLKALKDSFVMEGTLASFTIPQGFPADLDVTIIALPDEKNAVIYFLENQKETGGWTPGETYSFDVSAYHSYRYIYLSAKVDDVTFNLVDIFPLLPEDRKSGNPQDRFSDAGI